MCYDGIRKVSEYIEYNKKIYCFKNCFLHLGTSHPCPWNHSEHKIRTGCLPDHLRGLQHLDNLAF